MKKDKERAIREAFNLVEDALSKLEGCPDINHKDYRSLSEAYNDLYYFLKRVINDKNE
jgi:hypothetical protein